MIYRKADLENGRDCDYEQYAIDHLNNGPEGYMKMYLEAYRVAREYHHDYIFEEYFAFDDLGGCPIGIVTVQNLLYNTVPGACDIMVFVDPDYRGQGVGENLLVTAIEQTEAKALAAWSDVDEGSFNLFKKFTSPVFTTYSFYAWDNQHVVATIT